jgi:hypothetical protein
MRSKTVALAIVCLIFLSSPAFGWDSEYHVQMVKDAIALCPYELRVFMSAYIEDVLEGAVDPNMVLATPNGYAYNYRKHYYIPEGDKGDAPEEVEKLALSVMELLMEDIDEKNVIAYRMGMIGHYVANSIQPKRYIGVAPRYPLEFLISESYLTVTYDGFHSIVNYSDDLKGFVDYIWYKNLTDDDYYNAAVNFIVDTWTTIWGKSGLPFGEMVVIGSKIRPEPVEVTEEESDTVFEPSVYFDLERLGESEVYDETSVEGYETETPGGEEPANGGETPGGAPENGLPEDGSEGTTTPPPPDIPSP